jgi:hypothetical protein
MRIYISGQITGLARDVCEALFSAAAAEVLAAGHEPVNPLEIPSPPGCGCPDAADPYRGHAWACCLRKDIHELTICDALRLLPNWTVSRGATFEHDVASTLEMPVYRRAVDIPLAIPREMA